MWVRADSGLSFGQDSDKFLIIFAVSEDAQAAVSAIDQDDERERLTDLEFEQALDIGGEGSELWLGKLKGGEVG